jgi:hypothetical protein
MEICKYSIRTKHYGLCQVLYTYVNVHSGDTRPGSCPKKPSVPRTFTFHGNFGLFPQLARNRGVNSQLAGQVTPSHTSVQNT